MDRSFRRKTWILCLPTIVNEFFFHLRIGQGCSETPQGKIKAEGNVRTSFFSAKGILRGVGVSQEKKQQNTPFAVPLPSEREAQRYFSDLADFVRLLIPRFL